MIGMSNHLLSMVFRFHYHSRKVIGSLGNMYSTKATASKKLDPPPFIYHFLGSSFHLLPLVLVATPHDLQKKIWSTCTKLPAVLLGWQAQEELEKCSRSQGQRGAYVMLMEDTCSVSRWIQWNDEVRFLRPHTSFHLKNLAEKGKISLFQGNLGWWTIARESLASPRLVKYYNLTRWNEDDDAMMPCTAVAFCVYDLIFKFVRAGHFWPRGLAICSYWNSIFWSQTKRRICVVSPWTILTVGTKLFQNDVTTSLVQIHLNFILALKYIVSWYVFDELKKDLSNSDTVDGKNPAPPGIYTAM